MRGFHQVWGDYSKHARQLRVGQRPATAPAAGGALHGRHWALPPPVLTLTPAAGTLTTPALWKRKLRVGEFVDNVSKISQLVSGTAGGKPGLPDSKPNEDARASLKCLLLQDPCPIC